MEKHLSPLLQLIASVEQGPETPAFISLTHIRTSHNIPPFKYWFCREIDQAKVNLAPKRIKQHHISKPMLEMAWSRIYVCLMGGNTSTSRKPTTNAWWTEEVYELKNNIAVTGSSQLFQIDAITTLWCDEAFFCKGSGQYAASSLSRISVFHYEK